MSTILQKNHQYLEKERLLKEKRSAKKAERKSEDSRVLKILREGGWKLRYIKSRYSGAMLSIAYRDKPPYLCTGTAKSFKDMHCRSRARKILLEKINGGETFPFLEGTLATQFLLEKAILLQSEGSSIHTLLSKLSGQLFNKEISTRIIFCLLDKVKSEEFKIPREWKRDPGIWGELILEVLQENRRL